MKTTFSLPCCVLLLAVQAACGDGGSPGDDTAVDGDVSHEDDGDAVEDQAEEEPLPPPTPVGRGYEARACGFDLDDDGTVGGEGDCSLCDGETQDPDGDGVDEDFLYVDADEGSDETGDGSPAAPYRTIRHAWNSADGPEDGAEDIICFRGTAIVEENIVPNVSGVPGVRTKPATGWEVRDWEFPSDPTMLVGWDSDGDGEYPPYDPDDRAVLDGGPNQLQRVFTLNEHGRAPLRYAELAHFEVRDYGYTTPADGSSGELAIGFMFLGRNGEATTHIHVHDIEMVNVNRDKPCNSNAINFNFFVGGMPVRYFAVTNFQSLETGGYFTRGGVGEAAETASGPLRFQRMTVTHHGCDYGVPPCEDESSVTGYKVWGYLEGMEILDNYFDANVDAWLPRPTGPINAIIADGCVNDWVARNNTIRNYKSGLTAKGTGNSGVYDNAGFCRSRPNDNIYYDGNTVIVDTEYYQYGVYGASFNDGNRELAGGSSANITVTNNFFYAFEGFRSCLLVSISNDEMPAPGRIVFAGNTCHGGLESGLGDLVEIQDPGGAFPYPALLIADNVFSGLAGGGSMTAFSIQYAPDSLEVHHNTYSPGAEFMWLETGHASLEEWRAATGLDEGSLSCDPAFVDAAAADLHLEEGDTCALGAGVVLDMLDHDCDGDPRPQGDPDVGADEL